MRLLALAAAQSDVLSAEQIHAHGLGRSPLARLVAQGRWQRLDCGLYVARDRAPDWQGLAWGGVLLGGDQARLGGFSAGHLHGLNAEPAVIEILVPWGVQRRDRGPWAFVRERAGVRSTRTVGNPPRITVEDTVLDLTAAGDDADVVDLVTSAVQSRSTDPEKLLRALDRRKRHPHRPLLHRLLADVALGAESPLEIDFLHDVEMAHGLPIGARQRVLVAGRQDVRYEEFATLVELDGRLGHEGMGRFRDMDRDNASVVRGEAPLRYGWFAVRCEACRSAAQLGHVLMDRGWPGPFLRCDRCRDAPLPIIG